MDKSRRTMRLAGGVALVFGVLTLFSGTTALLGALDMGAVVPFVLWFNTVAGLAYVLAGVGLWSGRRWAYLLSVVIFAATVLVFAGFAVHVAQGGAFEMRTVFAMALRATVWGVIAFIARQSLRGK